MTKPIKRCEVCGARATLDIGVTVESLLCDNIVCQQVYVDTLKEVLLENKNKKEGQ